MKKSKELDNTIEARFGPRDMLYFVIWFGMLSGLAEVVLPQMNECIGGRPVHLRPHVLWVSPLANVIVLSIVSLAVLPLLRRLSRPTAIRIAFALLASTVFLNLLVLEFSRLYRIHFAAKMVLAAGLAVALQGVFGRWALGFERFLRRTTIAVVLLVLVLAAAADGWRRFQEHKIIATLPESRQSAPNVLLIVLDTVRAESMSLYGYERPTTPFLENLAKQGVLFEWAIAPCSWTLPTHASFFTGRFQSETGTNWTIPLGPKYPTLAEVLTDNGYVTGAFVANTLACRVEHGIARGFARYKDYALSPGEFARGSALIRCTFAATWVRRLLGYYEKLDRVPAHRVTSDFLGWVDRVPRERPFFAFLNYFDAHQPYLPPANFAEKFGSTDQLDSFLARYIIDDPCIPTNTTIEEIESMRNAYDGAIAYIDQNMERLFGELEKRDILDNTIVIVVSDHGEEFGEHGSFGHGTELYTQSIRVPLILRYPGLVPSDVIVQEPVTLRDVPATILSLLGLPNHEIFPGKSLERCWPEPGVTKPPYLDPVLSELYGVSWNISKPRGKEDMLSLVTGQMHYISNGDGSEEVYDLHNDPAESNDISKTPRGGNAAAQAKDILKQEMR
ncbi:MAG: sulfatase [Planctomycetota bacterium]